jgi:GAF domain-containing protein
MINQPPTVPESETWAASREQTLADLFVALADTLVADFDVVELLDRLVTTCVGLFDIAAAGVLLFDAKRRLQLMAASNERAEHLEVFQIQADQGPCLDCARSRKPVSISDLWLVRERWPRFQPAADIVGFRAVHAVPLRLRQEGLGTLGLFHTAPTELSTSRLHTAQALADVATIGILQQQHARHASLLTEQLQGALDSRVAIEQAKGILAENSGVSMDVAFDQLRRYARDHNLKLSDVALQVAARQLAPATVVAARRSS